MSPGGYGVYVLDADGRRPVRVSGPGETHHAASWSPDATEFACVKIRDAVGAEMARRRPYILSADGAEQRALTADDADYDRPAWSPVGSNIALIRRARGALRRDLALLRPDGSDLRILSDEGSVGVHRSVPAWSADGRGSAHLAFSNVPADVSELRVLDVATLESSLLGVAAIGDEGHVGYLAWSYDQATAGRPSRGGPQRGPLHHESHA